MTTFLTVLHIMVCIVIVVAVLLQRGKGAEIGAVFGGGASSTVFGARGAGNFLTKLTTFSAVTFMGTSLALAYFSFGNAEEKLFETGEPAAEASETAEPTGEESPFAEVGEPVVAEPETADPTSEAPGSDSN